MGHASFGDPDLTTFCRLDGLGLVAVVQRLGPDRAVIERWVVEVDDWCHKSGSEGRKPAHRERGWRWGLTVKTASPDRPEVMERGQPWAVSGPGVCRSPVNC